MGDVQVQTHLHEVRRSRHGRQPLLVFMSPSSSSTSEANDLGSPPMKVFQQFLGSKDTPLKPSFLQKFAGQAGLSQAVPGPSFPLQTVPICGFQLEPRKTTLSAKCLPCKASLLKLYSVTFRIQFENLITHHKHKEKSFIKISKETKLKHKAIILCYYKKLQTKKTNLNLHSCKTLFP